MCIVLFDEERLDAIIMEVKMEQLPRIMEFIAEANENGFDVIITQEDLETVYRRKKRAGSVKRFLALLEASSKKVRL